MSIFVKGCILKNELEEKLIDLVSIVDYILLGYMDVLYTKTLIDSMTSLNDLNSRNGVK